MKTQPTDIDREAATLFACVDGMRAGWSYNSVTSVPPRERWTWERVTSDGKEPHAIDTDDPATVGVMLAQVEATVVDGLPVELYRITPGGWWQTDAPGVGGPTRGAALVAAMRALKAKRETAAE